MEGGIMMRGKVSMYSQPHVLRHRMEEAGLTHGQETRVNLRKVRVTPTTEGEGIVYFCEMSQIEVVEVLSKGDGKRLPDQAVVENVEFSRRGMHDLYGAILNSNGVLQVKADEKTEIVKRSLLPWRQWFQQI